MRDHVSHFVFTVCLLSFAEGAQATWLEGLSGDLRKALGLRNGVVKELAGFGEPMIGNTVAEFGIQHIMLAEPPPESPFVQIDLTRLCHTSGSSKTTPPFAGAQNVR
ncbi:hypothetical protein GCM10023213_32190 [Prosthecobacter algae]|uniref:Uncharacterized protein n=1 Tax=Prosthecobacter algae TaxID=1144682 RepID=A0ABP9PAZ4_9BACT